MLDQGWTEKDPAVDIKGKVVPSWDHFRAVAWSLQGAISGCEEIPHKMKLRLIGSLSAKFGADYPIRATSHAESVRMLTACIEDGNAFRV